MNPDELDMSREDAYKQVAEIARKYGLISAAWAGVITIVHPNKQRQAGIEAKCLYMAGLGPFPAKDREG